MAYDRWFLFATGSGSYGWWFPLEQRPGDREFPAKTVSWQQSMSRYVTCVTSKPGVMSSCKMLQDVARCCKMLQDVARSQENALHSSNLWCSAALAASGRLGLRYARCSCDFLLQGSYKSKWSLEISRTECLDLGFEDFYWVFFNHKDSFSFIKLLKDGKSYEGKYSTLKQKALLLLCPFAHQVRR